MEKISNLKRLRKIVYETTGEDMDGNTYTNVYFMWSDRTWEKAALLTDAALDEFKTHVVYAVDYCGRGILKQSLILIKEQFPEVIVWMK